MNKTLLLIGLFFVAITLYISCSEEEVSSPSNPKQSKMELTLGGSLVGNKSDIPYGTTELGIEITKIFTIKNIGDANLTLSNLAVTGEFSISQNFNKLLVTPTESITFAIKFNSTSVGKKTGKISFNSTDKDFALFEINLTAEALKPTTSRLELSQGETILVITPTPTVDFGLIETGKNTSKEFTLKNVGSTNLSLSNLSVPSGFTIENNFGKSTLADQESTTFKIKYTANTIGLNSGNLTFTTNDPIRNTVQVNIKAETIKDIHIYFPLKIGNNWTFDRKSPVSVSTSEILTTEITNARNIFGGGVTVEKITKNVYDYLLTGDYFLGDNFGTLSIKNLKFFNEYDSELTTDNYTFDLTSKKIPIQDLVVSQGTLEDIVVTIKPKVYLDIKKLTGNQDYTVNGKLYSNTQNIQWDFYISATATFSGTLITSSQKVPITDEPFTPHPLIDKQSIGYNQIRLARDIGPIEAIQNIDFKDIKLNKEINTVYGKFDVTTQLNSIETQIKSVNDINSSKLKSYSVSF
jgi:hypothetical protein